MWQHPIPFSRRLIGSEVGRFPQFSPAPRRICLWRAMVCTSPQTRQHAVWPRYMSCTSRAQCAQLGIFCCLPGLARVMLVSMISRVAPSGPCVRAVVDHRLSRLLPEYLMQLQADSGNGTALPMYIARGWVTGRDDMTSTRHVVNVGCSACGL